MSDTNRIDPVVLKTIADKWNLKIIDGTFCAVHRLGKVECCPITAYAIHNNETYKVVGAPTISWSRVYFGVDYHVGFWTAFDGRDGTDFTIGIETTGDIDPGTGSHRHDIDSERYKQGREDGAFCRKELL